MNSKFVTDFIAKLIVTLVMFVIAKLIIDTYNYDSGLVAILISVWLFASLSLKKKDK